MAARPTNVSSMWIRSERRVSTSSSLVPTQVRTSNTRVCGVELEDRAAVGVGQAHRLGDDRRQHLVEVAARADGVADLPEGPQLVDRAREVAPALLERLEELHVLDRDRALRGEGVGEGDRLVVERLDLVAPERDDAEDALVDQHRHAEQGADAAELAGPVPLVVGVGDHVRDLDGAALQPDAADDRPRVLRDRAVLDSARYASGAAEQVGQAVDVAVELVDHPRVRAAEPDRVAHDRLEHGLQLELPAPDDVEHLAGGRLLLDRLAQVPRELLDARVDRCSGFLVGGHGSSRWRVSGTARPHAVSQPYLGPPVRRKFFSA